MTVREEYIIKFSKELIDFFNYEKKIQIKCFGSVAVAVKCPSSVFLWDLLERTQIYDLDLVALPGSIKNIIKMMREAGFRKDPAFIQYYTFYNKIIFHPPRNSDLEFPIEINPNPLVLVHNIDLGESIRQTGYCVSITNLFITKLLQNENTKPKHLTDLAVILNEYQVGDSAQNSISTNCIIKYFINNWKKRFTIEKNIFKLYDFIYSNQYIPINTKYNTLLPTLKKIIENIADIPKTLCYKIKEKYFPKNGNVIQNPSNQDYEIKR
jgi:hypothetical protein